MTELDPNILPLAVSGQALNRVIGTQVNDEGVSSLALFPLKVLSATGGRIAKLAIATRPATPGEEQPATLTVYTDDGGSYPVKFTIPPGARGYSITDIGYEQDEVKPGEACTGRLTFSLENGTKLPPVEIHLPPGKDSLTITDTSVTQEPVEAGKPSKVTVTVTHSDGSKAVYSYEAPPGAEGFVDGEHFVARHDGKLNSPTIFYGPNESYTLTPQSDGSLVARDDKQNILFSLSKTEGHIGDDRIATASDLKNETNRATAAEAEKLSLSGGTTTGALYTDGNFIDQNGQTLSQPNGNAIGDNRFYNQLAQDKSGNLFGRLIMKKDNTWTHVLECTPDGKLTNINGKSLALIDDITAETAGSLPLSGGHLSGELFVDASFHQNGETLSKSIGTQIGNSQFYMQAVQPDNVNHLLGRLAIKDLDGNFYKVLEADTTGTLKNLNGDNLATISDVQEAEARLLPLSGGHLSGELFVDASFHQNGEALSKTLGTQVGTGQFYMQAVQPDDVKHLTGRLVIKDLDGNFYRVLEADTKGNLKNLNGKILATTDDVQEAKDTRLPLTGGALTGDISLEGTINGDNLYSRTLYLTTAGDKNQGQLQLVGTKTNPATALTTLAADGRSASLFLNADNSVTTPHNSSLLEIMMGGGSTGRVVMQVFEAKFIAAGLPTLNWIDFPIEFSEPALCVVANVNNEYGGLNANANGRGRWVGLCNKLDQQTETLDITKSGFRAFIARGDGFAPLHASVCVMAVGIIK